MEQRITVLTYAVRGRVILKYSGQLGLMLAILTTVPLVVAVLDAEWSAVQRYAFLCIGLFVTGGLLARLPAPARIQENEAITVTALAFLLAPLMMAWPMMTANISFINALFEAISGVTTTGLSTLGSVETRPASFLFARAWMQWYGGLGIVILSVALLMGHHAAAHRLTETLESGETLIATARTHARHSIIIYVALTLFGLILIWSLSGNGFTSLLHVLSAVSTGGFSSFDNSLAALSSGVSAAVMAVAFLGAVSLPLYWYVFHAGWAGGLRTLFEDVELRTLLLTCLLSGSVLSLLLWMHHSAMPWYHGMN